MAKNNLGRPSGPPLTEYQRELLATADDELRRRSSIMSFDVDKLVGRVNSDAWQSVIQAHLYYDHVITLLLSENVPQPQSLRLDRIGFSQKLDLASALSLVPPDYTPFLRRINTVRNQISHDLDFEVNEEHVASIIGRLSSRLRKIVEDEPFPEYGTGLRKALIITIILLDMHRQRTRGDKITGEKLAAHLRGVAGGQKFDYVD